MARQARGFRSVAHKVAAGLLAAVLALAPAASFAQSDNVARGLAVTALGKTGVNGRLWLQNADSNNLRHWRACLAKVRTAAGSCKVAIIGNSKTAGYVTAGYQQSYPAYFAKRLNAIGVPALYTSWFGNQNYGGDAGGSGSTIVGYTAGFNAAMTWSNTSGWAVYTTTGTPGGYAPYATTAAGTMSFNLATQAPGQNIDQCDVYTYAAPGSGTLNVNFDGGTNTAINENATSALVKTTLTATAATNHVVNVAWASGGNAYIAAIVCRLSTASNVEVYNMGWGASTTAKWVDASKPWAPAAALPNTYQPDITIIPLDTNDYTSSYNISLSQYQTNLQTIITNAKTTGDCVVVAEIPSSSGRAAYPVQNQYHAVEQSLAAANGCLFVDVTDRWGGAYEPMNAFGWYEADGVHAKAAAYSDEGSWLADVLATLN